jgi:hypothetical protein
LSSYDDKVTNPYYTGRKRDKTLFVLSSAVQAVSAFIFIKNLSGHKKNTNSTALKALSNLSIHANGRGDFLASYRFQL